MGKRNKRLTMAKFAKKFSSKREALFGTKKDIEKEEIVSQPEPEPEVIVEPEPEPEVIVEPEPEPEVIVESESPKRPLPNALKKTSTSKAPTRKKTTRKRSTTRKKSTPTTNPAATEKTTKE
jgi:protein TonB